MILDKLIEKKDITAYIDNRTKYLNLRLENELLKHPPEKREYFRQRHSGRIHELLKLRNIIKTKNIKDISKDYHSKNKKMEPNPFTPIEAYNRVLEIQDEFDKKQKEFNTTEIKED